jgi:hypothetical protein
MATGIFVCLEMIAHAISEANIELFKLLLMIVFAADTLGYYFMRFVSIEACETEKLLGVRSAHKTSS